MSDQPMAESIDRPMTLEELAVASLRGAREQILNSNSIQTTRELALWFFTQRDCFGGCQPDLGDFNCLCCCLKIGSDAMAMEIWRQLTREQRIDVKTELICAGCHS